MQFNPSTTPVDVPAKSIVFPIRLEISDRPLGLRWDNAAAILREVESRGYFTLDAFTSYLVGGALRDQLNTDDVEAA